MAGNDWKVGTMFESLIPQNCRVALLAGGTSGERDVSLASGEGAREALEEAGFPVTQLDPADKEDLKRLIDGDFDVAFLCLHGRGGEDGAIQGLLEVIRLPYIGSGVWSSALAMDKSKAKVFYEAAGLATPPSVTLRDKDERSADDLVAELGERCVVKPAAEGSALGVFIVEGSNAVSQALEQVLAYDDEVLVLLQEQLKFSLFEHLVIITPDGNAYDENGNQYYAGAKSAFRPPCWVTGQYQRSVRLETTAPESS